MRKCLSGRSHSITYEYIQEWAVNNNSLKMSLTHECPFWEKVLSLTWSCALTQPLLGSTTQSLHTNVQSTTCSSQPAVGHSVYSTAHPSFSYSLCTSSCLWLSQVQPASPHPPSRLLPALTVLFLSLCCLLSVGSICFPCGVLACSVFLAPTVRFISTHPVSPW